MEIAATSRAARRPSRRRRRADGPRRRRRLPGLRPGRPTTRPTPSWWPRATSGSGEVLERRRPRHDRGRPARSRRRRRRSDRSRSLEGRVALGPDRRRARSSRPASVTDGPATPDLHEVAISLPRGRSRSAGSRRASGSTCSPPTTTAPARVVRGAEVVQIGADDDGSLTSDREVDARRRRALRRRGRRGRPRAAHRRRHRRAVDLRRCHAPRIRSRSPTTERPPPTEAG